MKLILRSGNSVDYPRTAKDITLAQYIHWHNDIRPTLPAEIIEFQSLVTQLDEINKDLDKYYKQSNTNTPDELQQYLDSGQARNSAKRFLPGLLTRWQEIVEQMERLYFINEPLWLSKNWHPYQLRVVRALTGIEAELTVDELAYLFEKCVSALAQPQKIEYKQIYLHEGVTYTLPDALMSKSTLIEFAEAAQYEAALKQTQSGDANGLLKMCAVLMRPAGVVEYSEEVFERNLKALETLPLQVAHEVSFFLTWLSSKYVLSSNRSILEGIARQMQD